MKIMQLIDVSRPFGFDDLALTGILATARRNNERDGITGSLICREDIYLQLLEGSPEVIDALFARINRDDRHAEVMLVSAEEVGERLFPNWAMRHDPARSWMWSREEVSNGASVSDVLGVFERVAREGV